MKISSAWLLGGVATMIAVPAFAQIPAPPRHDTRSANGVSYRDGAFSWDEQDLSIGGEDGLTFGRSYISSSADGYSPGWLYSTISTIRTSQVPTDPEAMPPPPQFQRWIFNVLIGGRSFAFTGGARDATTGAPKRGGTYQPVENNGTSLVYTGTSTVGYFTLTDSDGSIITFDNWVNGRVTSWIKPDGTRLAYSYGATTVVTSNRGYALVVEGKLKACVVNLAYTYVSPTAGATCPSDAQSVTYGYSAASFTPGLQLLTSATKAGATTTYEYVGADHLGCVKEPGQTICKVANQYGSCPEEADYPSTKYSRHYHDPVIAQQSASGESFSYTFMGGGYLNLCDYTNDYTHAANVSTMSQGDTTMTSNTGAQIRVVTTAGGLPRLVRDPLNRDATAEYTGNGQLETEQTQLLWQAQSEGNKVEYVYDDRGNIAKQTTKAKPGSGLADMVFQAAFPATCGNTKTCNKPTSMTDARLNTTDYTYDLNHGGMLTKSDPADANGIRSVKRSAYVQRYAWIKNGSGGYVHAGDPIWVLASQKTCRASTTSGDACVGGTSDEVVTSYDYGPDAGPNTLLLRGVAVRADGVTRWTCYGYDPQGNRISETKPMSGLASCPA